MSEMVGIALTPQLRRHTLLIVETLPAGALEISENMLDTLPMRPPRVGIEPTQTADG